MGEVFRAFDPRLGRPVAVKRVRGDSNVGTARQRLRREARAAAGLSHPSVVQVHDILEQEADDWIVMEWVDGPSLRQLIASGPLPPSQVIKLGLDIADGLAAAHRHDILHRDLKTENVLLAPDGRAKILDFGLAKQLQGDDATQLTESGRLLGTCRAMSPEQARGFEVDGRSDLFSLGVLLYELATGTSPFRSQTIAETLVKVCSHAPPLIRTLNGAMPDELASLIESLLEKAPQRRPASAVDVARGLQRLLRTLEETRGDFTEDNSRLLTGTDMADQDTWLSETAVDGPWKQRLEGRAESVSDEVTQSASFTGSYADATRLLRKPPARRAFFRGLGVLTVLLLTVPAVQQRLVHETTQRLVPLPAVASTMEPLLMMPEAAWAEPDITAIPRLVVLPFESLGPEENRYLAAGISEEITQRLASLDGLGVVSRTSARRAIEDGWTMSQIGRQLDVDFLLEGMVNSPPVSQKDQVIRITLRLVQVEDDTPIWTQSFDRLPDGLLELQAEIASGIVGRLDVALRQPEEAALALALTTEPDAYFAYLRGLDYKNQPGYSEERMLLAIQMFQQAVDFDPEFVEALAELSQMHSFIYFNFDGSAERRRQGQEAMEMALSLASNRWSVHMTQAYYRYRVEGRYEDALEAFGRAAKLAPHNAEVLKGIGYVRRRQGRLEDAANVFMHAFSLDRGNVQLAEDIAFTFKDMRDHEAADKWFAKALLLAPGLPSATTARALNGLHWKDCPDPMNLAASCSTAETRNVLNSLPDGDRSKAYTALLFLDLADAARLPEAQAAPFLQQALERMAMEREKKREKYIRWGSFWREIRLLEMAGMQKIAHAQVDELRREMEFLLDVGEGQGVQGLDENATVTVHLQAAHLARAYAYLGRREEALFLGQLTATLAERDRYGGLVMRKHLAATYLLCGMTEQALDEIESLLSLPSKNPLTRVEVALDPIWQSLWDERRFQALLQSTPRS